MVSYSLEDLELRVGTIAGFASVTNYNPPDIVWYDATHLWIPGGRYFKAGSRWGQQYDRYQKPTDYWDIAAGYANSVTEMAGDHTIVVGNWYGAFMTASGAGEATKLQLLPYMNVYSATTVSGKTVIVPADSDNAYWQTQTEETGYINSDDQWNGYRLRKWSNNFQSSTRDVVVTIEDTISSSNQLLLEEDVTSELGSGRAIQLIPPLDSEHLYLGSVRIQDDGSIKYFDKKGWRYWYSGWWSIDGYRSGSSVGNSFMVSLPPPAYIALVSPYMAEDGTNRSYGHFMMMFYGDGSVGSDNTSSYNPTGNCTQNFWGYHSDLNYYKRYRTAFEFQLSNNRTLRNKMWYWDSGNQTPEFGYIYTYGFIE